MSEKAAPSRFPSPLRGGWTAAKGGRTGGVLSAVLNAYLPRLRRTLRSGASLWLLRSHLPLKGGDRASVLPAALLTLATLTAPAGAQPPARVMSLNVCTDQLAMALAAPGQLVSVSFLAREPDLSPLHREAERYPVNRGMAEDVFLARPDLVVTGTYTLHNTTQLLKRLGFRVEEFSFVQTLDTIPRDIRRMGKLLGREEEAEAMAAEFEAGLAEVEASQCGPRPTALAYEQNGVALGKGTLADSVLTAAGFKNLATEEGVEGMAPFPLELVVEKKPDIVIVPGSKGDAPSLGAFVPRHPALRALPATRIGAFVPRGSWSCGGPAVLEAVKALNALRQEIASCEASP
ncbi:ABC transporter substrate-binding protein [Chelativorans salis]|uniref:ABC transporter substrate-binding protein n=1 Tax=Chelativorans salis TaxID=2978478 RepID=A0ABT2LLL4_9HYPH|nr:ABC transporter substrate-binding protein [Chelativorans sp. EGI FJ00035]MCT7374939.1 ABC transporter substrate-binding protein [Chelativorans sp. EGI FJ00035]